MTYQSRVKRTAWQKHRKKDRAIKRSYLCFAKRKISMNRGIRLSQSYIMTLPIETDDWKQHYEFSKVEFAFSNYSDDDKMLSHNKTALRYLTKVFSLQKEQRLVWIISAITHVRSDHFSLFKSHIKVYWLMIQTSLKWSGKCLQVSARIGSLPSNSDSLPWIMFTIPYRLQINQNREGDWRRSDLY